MKTFVVVDLEATCYQSNAPAGFQNEIIEIGAVKIGSDGKQIDTFGRFALPKNHPVISDFCNQLTTIKQSDIDNADPLKEVLIDFFNWVDGSDLISWGGYDKNQLIKDLRSNGLSTRLVEDLTHYNLKQLHANWNNVRKGMGVRRALAMEKMTFIGTPHRGIDDAINISRIFKNYLDRF